VIFHLFALRSNFGKISLQEVASNKVEKGPLKEIMKLLFVHFWGSGEELVFRNHMNKF
jgi:hypothetical protein